MKSRTLTVMVEKTDEGLFVARISELPDFEVKAKTMEELLESVRKNIMLYLQMINPGEKFVSISEFTASREAKA